MQEAAASSRAQVPLSGRGTSAKVAAGAGVGGCGFSAPQAPLSGRTCDTYMGEVAGGAGGPRTPRLFPPPVLGHIHGRASAGTNHARDKVTVFFQRKIKINSI